MRLLGAVRKGDAGERIGMVDTALFSRAERKAEDLAGRQAGKADLRLLFELLQIVLTDLGVEDVPVDEHRSALMPFLKDRKIGRAHVCTPVPNAHLVCRLLLEKK